MKNNKRVKKRGKKRYIKGMIPLEIGSSWNIICVAFKALSERHL
jgi:hypothetical protein